MGDKLTVLPLFVKYVFSYIRVYDYYFYHVFCRLLLIKPNAGWLFHALPSRGLLVLMLYEKTSSLRIMQRLSWVAEKENNIQVLRQFNSQRHLIINTRAKPSLYLWSHYQALDYGGN